MWNMLCIMDRLGTAGCCLQTPSHGLAVKRWWAVLLPWLPVCCTTLHKHQCSGDPAAHSLYCQEGMVAPYVNEISHLCWFLHFGRGELNRIAVDKHTFPTLSIVPLCILLQGRNGRKDHGRSPRATHKTKDSGHLPPGHFNLTRLKAVW